MHEHTPTSSARSSRPLRPGRRAAAVLGAGALTLPVVGVAGAAIRANARSQSFAKAAPQKVTGQTALAGQWGSVQVNVTFTKTTATGSKRVRIHYSDLGGSYSYHTSRSQFIMSQALPMLRQEFLQAQSTNIQMVSGATYTSQAFEQSLQSALLKAK